MGPETGYIETGYRDILDRLIGFDTTSRNSNLELIDFIVHFLSQYGIAHQLVPNDKGDKASLFATIGPKEKPGIALSGHTDVVPIDGQQWDTDPFRLVERDSRLYGRGTCDMKGFLACMLAAVPDFAARDLKTPIHLVFSYDEEIGCTGVRPMINEFGSTLIKPRMVVVGEPTDMKVVDAHKGIMAYVTEVRGAEAHSSVPDLGVNSIFFASRLISILETLGGKVKKDNVNERFTPPYSSVHVGVIQGGTALNIVPKACRFVWEVRCLPEFDSASFLSALKGAEEELVAEMQAIYPQASIETVQTNQVPTFKISGGEAGAELISMTLKCAEQNDLHAVSYGTEAGLFELGGCPTIICGPGSIEQAHAPNEYVTVGQMEKCMQFMRKLADYVS